MRCAGEKMAANEEVRGWAEGQGEGREEEQEEEQEEGRRGEGVRRRLGCDRTRRQRLPRPGISSALRRV